MFMRRVISSRTINFVRYCVHKSDNIENLNNVPKFSVQGDSGESQIAGLVLPKSDKIFDAIGATEELQSYIGLAREFALESGHDYGDKLKRCQTVLVDIGLLVSQSDNLNVKSISKQYTKELEEWINDYSSTLPPVEHFILPGGGTASAALHVARSVCRRTERKIVSLVRNGVVDIEAQIYLNRLADFLLTISRVAVKEDKRSETIYIPKPLQEPNKK